jgi:hypothetical protein
LPVIRENKTVRLRVNQPGLETEINFALMLGDSDYSCDLPHTFFVSPHVNELCLSDTAMVVLSSDSR